MSRSIATRHRRIRFTSFTTTDVATLLKAPSPSSKGVVVFTTQERDRRIAESADLRERIERLKERWLVGLHHNWHDFAFTYDPLFDFSMAGEEDLIEVSGTPFPVVPLDACNFVPSYFTPASAEPFWDVLYIARAVGFKRLPEFLQCIRTLYDRGYDYRVLLISPMPPFKRSDRPSVFYELRQVYESMFSLEERARFTLLDPTFGYPFPFDLETIAHFYRSSRIFVHFANDERRCRVAGYAWACGLPVVTTDAVASLLPAVERHPPAYYKAREFAQFPDRIVEAIEHGPDEASREAQHSVSEADTVPELLGWLESLLGAPLSSADREEMALGGLGLRLGRHHGIGGPGPNTVPMEVDALVTLLESDPERVTQAVAIAEDPEHELAGTTPGPAPPSRLRRWASR